jgi:uncharacterized protein
MVLAPLSCVLAILVQSVSSVPDPRPAHVVDQAGVIDATSEARLEAVAAALERDRGAQLVVVTVDAVDGTPKAFATALFARWQLGRAGHDDGVLVLMVTGQRRLEIETGVGVETALPAPWLATLQADAMVPAFKRGELGGGLVAGVEGIDRRLRALPGEADVAAAPGEYRSDGVVAEAGSGGGGDVGSGMGISTPTGANADADADARDDDGGTSPVTGVALGVGGLGVLGGAGYGLMALRRRRRRCATCLVPMIALGEAADDAHLSSGQRTEERIGSMDYEVLICPGCQASRTLVHGTWFSGKRRCPGCAFKTATRTSTTLVHATYDHGGRVRETVTCANCPHSETREYATARRTRPTPSSSSSSSRGSSSYRSSSSSSSRSSSSSGGRSRGGGAGSSW